MPLKILIPTLIMLALAQPAMAADIVFTCVVKEKPKDGEPVDLLIRYDLTFASRTVVEHHNLGQGFYRHREHPYVLLDEKRFVSLDDEREYEVVDRVTGAMYFINKENGVTQEGKCQESLPGSLSS
jgi:hypothetical protein